MVTVKPGHHVTIPQANEPKADAVVVTAESVHSVNGTSRQQQPLSTTAQQPPRKRGFLTITHAWLWELVACFFAIVIVIVEIVLLVVYNNTLTSAWRHSWQLNSVFAFLTALLEAAVAFAVGNCLGQLRWLWFQKGNQELRWMDKLTNARAPSGALAYMFSGNPLK